MTAILFMTLAGILNIRQIIYDERIWDILSDENGLLWILSRNGLNIYNPSLERFFKITSDSITNLSGLIGR